SVAEPRRGRREVRRRPPRLPGRAGPGSRRRPGAARRDGRRDGTGACREVRRAHQAQPHPGPCPAGRGARPAGDRPAPELRAAHCPALRPRRHLAGTRRRPVEGTARQQARPPFKPYLDQHAGQEHGSFTRLFREIRDLGYDGSYSVVRNYLDQIRPARTPLPQAPPTVRDVTNWLTRRPDSLTGDEKPRLTAILDRCPELQTASDQVRAFAGMLTELTGQACPSGSPMPATPGCPASR